MAVPKSEPILIVGGGAFGLSTVVHLLRAGYKDITVLDKDDEIPSRWSAANDLNKIVRAEYEDALYQDLTVVSNVDNSSASSMYIIPGLTHLPNRKRLKLGRNLYLLPTFTRSDSFIVSQPMHPRKLMTLSIVSAPLQSVILVSDRI